MSFARVSQDLAIIKTVWLSELMWLVFNKGLNKKMLNKPGLLRALFFGEKCATCVQFMECAGVR